MTSPILTVDVAHPPVPADRLDTELTQALVRVQNSPVLHVLKIIHGYGSSGKGGVLRELVLNWVYRNRKRIRSVIEGNSYTLFDSSVQEMRKAVGDFQDEDLRNGNPGITVLWVS